MTSPYAWYQYFVNTADADVIRYLRWFTFLSAEEFAELEQATAERPHERAAQRRLAQELTTLVHGEAATTPSNMPARRSSVAASCRELDEPTLAAALTEAAVAELTPGGPDAITDLLVATGLSASKGAARRTIAEGGVSVNNVRVEQRRVGAAGLGLPVRTLAGAAPRASGMWPVWRRSAELADARR